MSPAWSYVFTARARRDLKRLDLPVRRKVIAALDGLVTSDPPEGDVRKLAGSDEWRLRVGEWRVRFQRDPPQRMLYVLRVLPRGRAYRE
ncbi:MAG: type II toxin-antitoxin system RelE family toxin [Solirubrobacteraceae bacterium]